jgi:hypothetical protein
MSNLLFELASKIPILRGIQQVYSERNALRQLYERDNYSSGMVPGKYYRQVDAGNGNIKGFSAVCHCGQEYRMLSMFECFRQSYRCPQCKMEINLLRHVGAIDASGKFLIHVQQLEPLLNKLQARPVGTEQAAPFLPSDGNGTFNDAWEGHKVGGRDKAFSSGDPAMMGPGF